MLKQGLQISFSHHGLMSMHSDESGIDATGKIKIFPMHKFVALCYW